MDLELGLDTFGDVTVTPDGDAVPHRPGDPQRGRGGRPRRRARPRLLRRRRASPQATSRSPRPRRCSAGLATATKRIHLGSAVTVLSSTTRCGCSSASPPWMRCRTAALRSSSAAVRSPSRFPLFGFELAKYEQLFEEKVDLFAALLQRGAGDVERQPHARRSPTRRSSRRPNRVTSRPGSASAAAPSRWFARPATTCRSCSRSSVAPRAVRALRGPLPPGARPDRATTAASDRGALAGLRRRHRRAGPHRVLAALQGDARPHRPRARLAARA